MAEWEVKLAKSVMVYLADQVLLTIQITDEMMIDPNGLLVVENGVVQLNLRFVRNKGMIIAIFENEEPILKIAEDATGFTTVDLRKIDSNK